MQCNKRVGQERLLRSVQYFQPCKGEQNQKNSRSKKDLQNAVFTNGLFPIFGPKPGQNNFFKIFSKKVLTNNLRCGNIVFVADRAIAQASGRGSIAQLGEHLPYKQRVIGSSPIVPTTFGLVVQLVRTLACHARGRGSEPHPGRHIFLVRQLSRQSRGLKIPVSGVRFPL